MIELLKRIMCKIKGHTWGFYVHDFGEQNGIYGKDLKDTMYCKRCGYGDLRK